MQNNKELNLKIFISKIKLILFLIDISFSML